MPLAYLHYKAISFYAVFNSEVQLGQREALMAILEKQNGQSLVVGAAATFGASARRRMLLIARMRRKTAKATIKKVMMLLMKAP
jgi:hypothetical protein